MRFPLALNDSVRLRRLAADDAGALATAYRRNREHLAPWDPARSEEFFTEAGQGAEILRLIAAEQAGAALPLLLETDTAVVGRLNLSGITRGAFESASLGYWIDAEQAGGGIMSRAVAAVVEVARDDLGLHRLEAGTLLHNIASQKVLTRNGFSEFGVAPGYLRIAGRWQDHRLFQRLLRD